HPPTSISSLPICPLPTKPGKGSNNSTTKPYFNQFQSFSGLHKACSNRFQEELNKFQQFSNNFQSIPREFQENSTSNQFISTIIQQISTKFYQFQEKHQRIQQ